MNSIHKFIYAIILLVLTNSLSATIYTPTPRNIDELVKTSDLIIIGTLEEIVDKRLFYGYQEGADLLAQKEYTTPFQLGLPLVDYAIHVQEVIMDDKEFPLADSGARTVIYRTFEDHDWVSSAEAIESRKGKIMFFLTRTPDNEAYGIFSIMHRIKLGDGSNDVSYSLNNEDIGIPFAPESKSEEFITDIKKHVKH